MSLHGKFVVYYGIDTSIWRRLRGRGTVVVAAEAWPPDLLRTLRRSGARVLGYASLGEATAEEATALNPAWLLGVNPAWGSQCLDVRRVDVAEWLLEKMAALWERGLDGFMLDTVDAVDAAPALRPAMAELVARVRGGFDSAYLLQNRGLCVLDQVRRHLDGVLMENCADRSFSEGDREWIAAACSRIRACGLDGFVLDYANQADRRASADLAARFGFGWYMAPDPRLDRLA